MSLLDWNTGNDNRWISFVEDLTQYSFESTRLLECCGPSKYCSSVSTRLLTNLFLPLLVRPTGLILVMAPLVFYLRSYGTRGASKYCSSVSNLNDVYHMHFIMQHIICSIWHIYNTYEYTSNSLEFSWIHFESFGITWNYWNFSEFFGIGLNLKNKLLNYFEFRCLKKITE